MAVLEAVIISGPRKGEFIAVGNEPHNELGLTPDEEAEIIEILSVMEKTTDDILQTLRAMKQEAAAWHTYMDERKKVRNEILRNLK